jgi:RNA polymerase sigma-70 factor (ECF subfamily)
MPDGDATSVELLERWRGGDARAADELFSRYTERLLRLARNQISPKLARRVDPEDVVQSVYRSFFADALADHFVLQRSGDLWRLLAAITLHKVQGQVERHTAAKRSIHREESPAEGDALYGLPVERLASVPSPSEAAGVADELDCVLRELTSGHRLMVEMRLQGHTFEAIAVATQRSERLVRRVLEQVKNRLQQRCQEMASG